MQQDKLLIFSLSSGSATRHVDEDDGSRSKSTTAEALNPKIVKTFVSPGLFESGDAGGENYVAQTCIVPIFVQW